MLLESHGCEIILAPLERPTASGKVERSEGIMKAMLRKIVNYTEAAGEKDFAVCLYEALVIKNIKNQIARIHGYSPAQRVLGKNPRLPGSVTDLDEAGNLGVLEDSLDPSARFHLIEPCSQKVSPKRICAPRHVLAHPKSFTAKCSCTGQNLQGRRSCGVPPRQPSRRDDLVYRFAHHRLRSTPWSLTST